MSKSALERHADCLDLLEQYSQQLHKLAMDNSITVDECNSRTLAINSAIESVKTLIHAIGGKS